MPTAETPHIPAVISFEKCPPPLQHRLMRRLLKLDDVDALVAVTEVEGVAARIPQCQVLPRRLFIVPLMVTRCPLNRSELVSNSLTESGAA